MGSELYGSYRVYEQLGKGGLATVHRAEQDTAQGIKQVALKRLIPTTDKRTVTLFLDEARLLRYLQHTNIPQTFDSGRMFGTYFIAMEYVPGATLKELIAHCTATVGPVPQQIALNLVGQLCDALDYAHKRRDEHGRPLGIIHRDVTPSNLIVSPTGLLKLVDFGLAKASLATEPSVAGIIKGKLGYVAPEYTRGKIDHRADLWAVGIIMYELLTGRRLFDGPDAVDTITRVRELPVPRPSLANPGVVSAVDDVVMTALQRDPRHRWTSAAAMRDRIQAVSAQLQDPADNQRVIDWVTWAFEQRRPRVVQLTPIIPMPIRSGPNLLVGAASTEPTEPVRKLRTRSLAWMMCVLLVVVGAVVWKIIHRT